MNRLNLFFYRLALLLLLFFALSGFIIKGMQQTALWIAVPGAAICAFFAVTEHRINEYFKLQVALYLWVSFTALFAFDVELATDQLLRIVGVVLLIYSFHQLSKEVTSIPWLYLVFLVYYIGMLYYARTSILTDSFDYTVDRLDDDILNANVIAYFTFFTTYIVFIFSDLVKSRFVGKVFRALFVLSPIWSFIIAVLTASRQVLIIQFPLVLVLFFIRYFNKRSITTKLLVSVICVVFTIALLSKGLSFYEGSLLDQRNEMGLMEDSRTEHFISAVKTGLEHPIVGVGPGCYGVYARGTYTFSHNNYTELFANSGFPALILCVIIYWLFIKNQWKMYKKTKDKLFLVFFTFGILFAFDNVFYVFYTAPWLMSFFFLVAGHSDSYYRTKYLTER